MGKNLGVLTAGGDSPGLNAAIRGLGKSAEGMHGMRVIGFKDGFRGVAENRIMELNRESLSGILTTGGTILGTSRDKPHKMPVKGGVEDMTPIIAKHYHEHNLECLVCIGGGGTQKNAFKLMQMGLNIITLPKTIDNDVLRTDTTFGFDTALGIATDAIDRLHSTAHSHHRIIVVEVMGHRAGWLALGAGIAGGADVILIPEIPYYIDTVADSIMKRKQAGKPFSIVAVAEGAVSCDESKALAIVEKKMSQTKDKSDKRKLNIELKRIHSISENRTLHLAQKLEDLTGLESRVTILGHLQRGGVPSAADRLLATRLSTACTEYIQQGIFGVLVAARGEGTKPVPLEKVVNRIKSVPLDHQWVRSAKAVGTCLGD
jgi:6-phosphofructokinase 1